MAALDPQYIINGLVARGVPLHVAQGVTARLKGESGLDPGINEISPTVAGSRGGYGLAQWTGPRRDALEAFAASAGKPVSDPDVQLDFLMHENAGSEKAAWNAVMATKDPVAAANVFTTAWERPGKPNMDATLATAAQYAGMPYSGPHAARAEATTAPASGDWASRIRAIFQKPADGSASPLASFLAEQKPPEQMAPVQFTPRQGYAAPTDPIARAYQMLQQFRGGV